MNDPSRWSLDEDPPRDEGLARLLRAADEPGPADGVDWEGLQAAILRRAALAPGAASREWWDVVVQWRRLAVAASVAAMLAAAALLWRTTDRGAELAAADAPPESVALARVVAAYPNEAVLTSMLDAARTDAFTSWDTQ